MLLGILLYTMIAYRYLPSMSEWLVATLVDTVTLFLPIYSFLAAWCSDWALSCIIGR